MKKVTTHHLCAYLLTLLTCLPWIGCGGVYDASVYGVVLLDSSPLPSGTISYLPTNGGPTAYGRIESDGSYFLRTGREEGVPTGTYQVTVVANEPPVEKRSKTGGPPAAGKLITPAWYRSAKTSGLKFLVEFGSNEINIDLSSEPPPDWKPTKKRRRSR